MYTTAYTAIQKKINNLPDSSMIEAGMIKDLLREMVQEINNLQEEIDTLSARNADLEHFYMAEKGPKIHNLIGHV